MMVTPGTEVLDPLRTGWPGLRDQDVLHTGARVAAGLLVPGFS